MTYRVFIGMWDDGDPAWTHVDLRGLDWNSAKQEMVRRLQRWRDEIRQDCQHCCEAAQQDLDRLKDAAPGRFEASADGDDYLILPE